MDRLPLPSNEADFIALMEQVDVSVAAQQIPIPGREMCAATEAARLLGVSFQWPLAKRAPRPGVYSGEDLHIRICDWVKGRYGDRLLIDFSPGRTVVWIRGALWVIRLPQLLGTWQLYASGVEPPTPDHSPTFTRGGIRKHNVIDSVEDCSDAMKHSLAVPELEAVRYAFYIAFTAYAALEAVRDRPLVREAMSDLASTVNFLTGRPPHAGQARWAAKMAAEKMIKAAIRSRGGEPAKDHRLRDLATKANEVGAPQIPTQLLNEIDCVAGTRYGEVPVTPEQVVAAHYASLQVACMIAEWLAKPAA
jgi:HEPN domain-containing protein